jgi:hypothetical protein
MYPLGLHWLRPLVGHFSGACCRLLTWMLSWGTLKYVSPQIMEPRCMKCILVVCVSFTQKVLPEFCFCFELCVPHEIMKNNKSYRGMGLLVLLMLKWQIWRGLLIGGWEYAGTTDHTCCQSCTYSKWRSSEIAWRCCMCTAACRASVHAARKPSFTHAEQHSSQVHLHPTIRQSGVIMHCKSFVM